MGWNDIHVNYPIECDSALFKKSNMKVFNTHSVANSASVSSPFPPLLSILCYNGCSACRVCALENSGFIKVLYTLILCLHQNTDIQTKKVFQAAMKLSTSILA